MAQHYQYQVDARNRGGRIVFYIYFCIFAILCIFSITILVLKFIRQSIRPLKLYYALLILNWLTHCLYFADGIGLFFPADLYYVFENWPTTIFTSQALVLLYIWQMLNWELKNVSNSEDRYLWVEKKQRLARGLFLLGWSLHILFWILAILLLSSKNYNITVNITIAILSFNVVQQFCLAIAVYLTGKSLSSSFNRLVAHSGGEIKLPARYRLAKYLVPIWSFLGFIINFYFLVGEKSYQDADHKNATITIVVTDVFYYSFVTLTPLLVMLKLLHNEEIRRNNKRHKDSGISLDEKGESFFTQAEASTISNV